MNYIAKLIRTGGWFDDTRPFIKVSQESDPKHYAPKYILENKDKFEYLISPPPTLPSDVERKNKKHKEEEYDTDLLIENEELVKTEKEDIL